MSQHRQQTHPEPTPLGLQDGAITLMTRHDY